MWTNTMSVDGDDEVGSSSRGCKSVIGHHSSDDWRTYACQMCAISYALGSTNIKTHTVDLTAKIISEYLVDH